MCAVKWLKTAINTFPSLLGARKYGKRQLIPFVINKKNTGGINSPDPISWLFFPRLPDRGNEKAEGKIVYISRSGLVLPVCTTKGFPKLSSVLKCLWKQWTLCFLGHSQPEGITALDSCSFFLQLNHTGRHRTCDEPDFPSREQSLWCIFCLSGQRGSLEQFVCFYLPTLETCFQNIVRPPEILHIVPTLT